MTGPWWVWTEDHASFFYYEQEGEKSYYKEWMTPISKVCCTNRLLSPFSFQGMSIPPCRDSFACLTRIVDRLEINDSDPEECLVRGYLLTEAIIRKVYLIFHIINACSRRS